MMTPSGTCMQCKRRPATEVWACCTMSAVHGQYEYRCEICVLSEQIRHALAVAETLAEKQAQLAQLLAKENNG